MGLVAMAIGAALGLGAFVLSLQGTPVERLWFYLLGATVITIIGLQLLISWIVMRVLDELAQRENAAQQDLVESEPANVVELKREATVQMN
jgi:ABC-type Co2+ transport system permease subunit